MPQTSVPDEYEEWLERLRSTYEAVSFTCVHRLGDRTLADQVSAQVVVGMLAKPGVFRFFGLPFSARIGHLAEDRIAAAKAGELGPPVDWTTVLRELRALPRLERRVFVLSCVHGHELPEIAANLGASLGTVREIRDQVLRHMRGIAGEEFADDDNHHDHQ